MVNEVQSVEVPAMPREQKANSYSDEKHHGSDSEVGGVPVDEMALLDDHDA